jgi:hypothetical protein
VKLQAILLVAYGLANALVYSALLPLWEGFDEPFHFGYVQHIANGQGFPDPRSSFLSREAGSSIRIAPASRIVQMNLPEIATTYSDFFSLTPDRRAAIRAQLREIPPEWRWQDSHFLNYEAHQSPLAYILLALPERALAGVPLPNRVLALRILGAFAGTLLLYFGADRLFRELGLTGGHLSAAIFCTFSSQMTWATMAHVANDWLSVPLAVWSLTLTIRYGRNPGFRTAAGVGGVLALGLLTKAYFLALVPVAFIVCLVKKRFKDLCPLTAIVLIAAGPWYVRNVFRYGSLSAMQEARTGIGASAVIRGAWALDWPRGVVDGIRATLWTGNNSFMSFSGKTLAAIAMVWLIALILWARSHHGSAEWITILHCAFFLAALAYSAVVSSINTGGIATGPSPWYSQVLLAPMLGLAFLGYSKSHRLGRFAASALVALFGYVLIATYVVKLIPLYGGYEGRTSLAALIALYSGRFPCLMDNLNVISLAPAGILLSLTAIVVTLAAVQVVVFIRSIN